MIAIAIRSEPLRCTLSAGLLDLNSFLFADLFDFGTRRFQDSAMLDIYRVCIRQHSMYCNEKDPVSQQPNRAQHCGEQRESIDSAKDCFYVGSPAQNHIANSYHGEAKSVSQIGKELRDTLYVPSNVYTSIEQAFTPTRKLSCLHCMLAKCGPCSLNWLVWPWAWH